MSGRECTMVTHLQGHSLHRTLSSLHCLHRVCQEQRGWLHLYYTYRLSQLDVCKRLGRHICWLTHLAVGNFTGT